MLQKEEIKLIGSSSFNWKWSRTREGGMWIQLSMAGDERTIRRLATSLPRCLQTCHSRSRESLSLQCTTELKRQDAFLASFPFGWQGHLPLLLLLFIRIWSVFFILYFSTPTLSRLLHLAWKIFFMQLSLSLYPQRRQRFYLQYLHTVTVHVQCTYMFAEILYLEFYNYV